MYTLPHSTIWLHLIASQLLSTKTPKEVLSAIFKLKTVLMSLLVIGVVALNLFSERAEGFCLLAQFRLFLLLFSFVYFLEQEGTNIDPKYTISTDIYYQLSTILPPYRTQYE
jgi:hypothetical protein